MVARQTIGCVRNVRGVLPTLDRSSEIRNRYPIGRQQVTDLISESIVTKSVRFGELNGPSTSGPDKRVTEKRREFRLSAFRVSGLSRKGFRQPRLPARALWFE